MSLMIIKNLGVTVQ